MKNKTLQPQHWTARVKQILWLLGYIAFVEYSYPTPFIQSRFGKLVYLIIVFYIIKAFWRLRQEQSASFYAKTQRWHAKITNLLPNISDYTRYRIMRIMRWGFMFYALGWLVDGVSDSCDGAIACVGQLPFMFVTNWQALLYFAIQLMMGMSTIFLMMWMLARMDLHKTILPDSIETRFSDVYGQDKAVESLGEVRGILDYPDEVEAKGGYMPGGVLLTGPPGTGKTLMAEAFAGETGKPFVSVGPESFTNMFMGVPILKVKMLFRHLRKLAIMHGGVVCFMDEIDALGSRGGGVVNQFLMKLFMPAVEKEDIIMGNMGAGSGALQMLLTEMSGMSKPKGLYNKIRVFLGFKPIPPPKYRILWIGATNMKETLDPALLRPGRFDRKIKVGYPDLSGRIETFQGYLNKVENNLTDAQVERLARDNPRATGASIKDAVNEGLLKVVREGADIITYNDVSQAIRGKMYGEAEGRQETEEDRRRVTLHEAAHAVASYHYRPEAPIQFASVEKRGGTGGMVLAIDDKERYTTKTRLVADIKVSLASVWAEKHYFDENISTGPRSDLEKATKNARAMFTKYAMGPTVMVWDDDSDHGLADDIQEFLIETYEILANEMHVWRDEVELVAQLLDQHGTVDGAEIIQLLDRMQQ